jgi:carboxyl-terminal processing protease
MDFGSRVRVGICLSVFLCFCVTAKLPARDHGEDRTPANLTDAVDAGLSKERARHWVEAIDSYENAIKHWPDSNELRYGLRRAKIQFGIERRYTDLSFERRLLRLPRVAALEMFDDVLEHIRLYYVDDVSATSFVAHGTESLYQALANEKFVSQNLKSVEPERIARLRRILRERFWNRPVADYSVAHDAVAEVCELAASEVGLSDTAVIMEYIFGGCNCLDDYSNFLTPDRLNDLHSNINGEFVGLGIEMKAESGKGLFLVNVLPDSPAQEGGLLPGEYITQIDGRSCLDLSTDEAARLLRGPQGTQVTLVVRDPDVEQVREGRFVRRAVEVKSIPVAEIVDRQRGIAYVRMTGFQMSSPRELDDALSRLSRQGMRSLIWDLRGNPGGLLDAATSMLDRFIDSGVLVSTRGRGAQMNSSYTATSHQKYNIPMVLLVDGDSASASEIVAGAVHDYKRGTIVGRTTYGKWSVQSIYHMPNDAGLRLTTAKFYSPRGHNLSKVGVRPDIVVKAEPQHVAYKNPPAMTGNPGAGEPGGAAGPRAQTARKPSVARNGVSLSDPDVKAALDVLMGQHVGELPRQLNPDREFAGQP